MLLKWVVDRVQVSTDIGFQNVECDLRHVGGVLGGCDSDPPLFDLIQLIFVVIPTCHGNLSGFEIHFLERSDRSHG